MPFSSTLVEQGNPKCVLPKHFLKFIEPTIQKKDCLENLQVLLIYRPSETDEIDPSLARHSSRRRTPNLRMSRSRQFDSHPHLSRHLPLTKSTSMSSVLSLAVFLICTWVKPLRIRCSTVFSHCCLSYAPIFF